jgi:hypothetical protein
MLIVLMAILGAQNDAGTAYWIIFGLWCATKVALAIKEVADGK